MSDPSDAQRLAGYIDVWRSAVDDFVAVLELVPAEQWATPTDLAGWDVRACAAHTAHLERVLAGRGEEQADIGDPPPAHITSLMGHYTEIGVVNRRDRSPEEIIAEIREVCAERDEQLKADPPTDASAHPPVIFGGVPWTWEVLLRNRPLDVWMHEQDIRRAVGLPGGMDSPAAQHTTDYLTESFGYLLAKKAGAPTGTTGVLDVQGSPTLAFVVGDDGRGRRLDAVPADPTVALSLDRESFIVLAGGRRRPADGSARIEGDVALGERILDVMATTP